MVGKKQKGTSKCSEEQQQVCEAAGLLRMETLKMNQASINKHDLKRVTVL